MRRVEPARAAVDQAHAQLVLQLGDAATDAGFRHAAGKAGAGKVARLDHHRRQGQIAVQGHHVGQQHGQVGRSSGWVMAGAALLQTMRRQLSWPDSIGIARLHRSSVLGTLGCGMRIASTPRAPAGRKPPGSSHQPQGKYTIPQALPDQMDVSSLKINETTCPRHGMQRPDNRRR